MQKNIMSNKASTVSDMLITTIRPGLEFEDRESVEEAFKTVKNQTDLVYINVNNKDEVGQLASSFNTFVSKIHNIVSQVKSSAITVADESEVLNQNINHSYESTRQQSVIIKDVPVSITEINKSTGEVSMATHKQLAAVEQMYKTIVQMVTGLKEVSKDADFMNDVVVNTSDTVSDMTDSSEKIADGVSEINKTFIIRKLFWKI